MKNTTTSPIRFRYTKEVGGIMYCTAHDGFAIEGYDWSDMCEEAYHEPDLDGTCNLVDMFIKVTRRDMVATEQEVQQHPSNPRWLT